MGLELTQANLDVAAALIGSAGSCSCAVDELILTTKRSLREPELQDFVSTLDAEFAHLAQEAIASNDYDRHTYRLRRVAVAIVLKLKPDAVRDFTGNCFCAGTLGDPDEYTDD